MRCWRDSIDSVTTRARQHWDTKPAGEICKLAFPPCVPEALVVPFGCPGAATTDDIQMGSGAHDHSMPPPPRHVKVRVKSPRRVAPGVCTALSLLRVRLEILSGNVCSHPYLEPSSFTSESVTVPQFLTADAPCVALASGHLPCPLLAFCCSTKTLSVREHSGDT